MEKKSKLGRKKREVEFEQKLSEKIGISPLKEGGPR